jgi:hypothetical protein
MLNAVDGSENCLIKVQGYDGLYSLDSDQKNESAEEGDSDEDVGSSGDSDAPISDSEDESNEE